MEISFYIAAIIAVFSTIMVITQLNAIHALLYLIVSLLAVAIIFFIIGAPFIAALEVIIYAGAIMVLFIFVVMMLNLGEGSNEQERALTNASMWIVPSLLALILFAELIYIIITGNPSSLSAQAITPREVALSLFGPYMLAVELAGFMLMAGIVGAYHLGNRKKQIVHRFLKETRQ